MTMTDRELADAAWAEFIQADRPYSRVESYPPDRLAKTHWGKGKAILDQIGVAVPPGPTPPPAGVRPFLDTSALNKPIPSPAPIHPDSDLMTVNNEFWVIPVGDAKYPYREWVGPRQRYIAFHSVVTLDPAKTTHPLIDVFINYFNYKYQCATTSIKVPMPPAVKDVFVNPDQWLNYDRGIYLYDDEGNAWESYQLTPPGTPSKGVTCDPNRWNAGIMRYYPAVEKTSVGYGVGETMSASNILGGLGLIRPEDFPVGFDPSQPIPHALRINGCLEPTRSGSPHPNYVAPSDSADYNGPWADAHAIPVGARMQLDPSVDVTTFTKKPWLQRILRTLQVYGCVLVDNSGAGTSGKGSGGLESCNARAVAPYKFPWEADGSGWAYSNGVPYAALSHFRVIDWTKWTGV